mmetsp:Transcript_26207/g.51308  ORF Transcript_26207/g.51308 Transcript_26207/m.51308 type:complete len:229 (-) Transcript_26207:74-760(-)
MLPCLACTVASGDKNGPCHPEASSDARNGHENNGDVRKEGATLFIVTVFAVAQIFFRTTTPPKVPREDGAPDMQKAFDRNLQHSQRATARCHFLASPEENEREAAAKRQEHKRQAIDDWKKERSQHTEEEHNFASVAFSIELRAFNLCSVPRVRLVSHFLHDSIHEASVDPSCCKFFVTLLAQNSTSQIFPSFCRLLEIVLKVCSGSENRRLPKSSCFGLAQQTLARR